MSEERECANEVYDKYLEEFVDKDIKQLVLEALKNCYLKGALRTNKK